MHRRPSSSRFSSSSAPSSAVSVRGAVPAEATAATSTARTTPVTTTTAAATQTQSAAIPAAAVTSVPPPPIASRRKAYGVTPTAAPVPPRPPISSARGLTTATPTSFPSSSSAALLRLRGSNFGAATTPAAALTVRRTVSAPVAAPAQPQAPRAGRGTPPSAATLSRLPPMLRPPTLLRPGMTGNAAVAPPGMTASVTPAVPPLPPVRSHPFIGTAARTLWQRSFQQQQQRQQQQQQQQQRKQQQQHARDHEHYHGEEDDPGDDRGGGGGGTGANDGGASSAAASNVSSSSFGPSLRGVRAGETARVLSRQGSTALSTLGAANRTGAPHLAVSGGASSALPAAAAAFGPPTYLASFPRSGNHLMRAFLEYMTGVPTLGCPGNAARDPPIWSHTESARRLLEPRMRTRRNADAFVFKSHGPMAGCQASNRSRRMILIVRHPVEAILSDSRSQRLSESHLQRYVNILRIFDAWTQPKLCVYYEDFVSDAGEPTAQTLRALGTFSGTETSRVEETIQAQDAVRQAALGTCNERTPQSHRDDHYYRNRASLTADDWSTLRKTLEPWRRTLLSRYASDLFGAGTS